MARGAGRLLRAARRALEARPKRGFRVRPGASRTLRRALAAPAFPGGPSAAGSPCSPRADVAALAPPRGRFGHEEHEGHEDRRESDRRGGVAGGGNRRCCKGSEGIRPNRQVGVASNDTVGLLHEECSSLSVSLSSVASVVCLFARTYACGTDKPQRAPRTQRQKSLRIHRDPQKLLFGRASRRGAS